MTSEEEAKFRAELAQLPIEKLIDRCVELKNWADALHEGWGKATERMSGLHAEPRPTAFPYAGRRDGRSNPRKKKPSPAKDG